MKRCWPCPLEEVVEFAVTEGCTETQEAVMNCVWGGKQQVGRSFSKEESLEGRKIASGQQTSPGQGLQTKGALGCETAQPAQGMTLFRETHGGSGKRN